MLALRPPRTVTTMGDYTASWTNAQLSPEHLDWLKELVDYGLLAPVLELNPDDLDSYIESGRRYMRSEMKEKVGK